MENWKIKNLWDQIIEEIESQEKKIEDLESKISDQESKLLAADRKIHDLEMKIEEIKEQSISLLSHIETLNSTN